VLRGLNSVAEKSSPLRVLPSTGGQSYCVGLWTGHRRRDPILQAVHAIWSLGGTISPFIVARFLIELPSSLIEQRPPLDIENITSASSENGKQIVSS